MTLGMNIEHCEEHSCKKAKHLEVALSTSSEQANKSTEVFKDLSSNPVLLN